MDNNHYSLLQLKILLFLLAVYCLACNNDTTKKAVSDTATAFDSTKWRKKDGDDYPYRDELLTYLITDNHLKGWKKDSVVTLLGQPDKIDSNYIFYNIAQQRLSVITLHTKTLVIKFIDDTVAWRKIHQ